MVFQFALNLDEQIRNLRGGISNSKEIADIVRDTTGQFTKYSTLIDQKFEEIVTYLSDIPFSNYSSQIEDYQKIIQNSLILEIENENNTISSFDEIFLSRSEKMMKFQKINILDREAFNYQYLPILDDK